MKPIRINNSTKKQFRGNIYLMFLLLLSSCAPQVSKVQRTAQERKEITFHGIKYFSITTHVENIELLLNNRTGERLRTFENARREALRRFQQRPFGIMNAGIFEPGETPTGLHIENYETLIPLNLEEGKGNFYTKPNGVFYVDKAAYILASTEFSGINPRARIAVQSGPLLMRNRKIMKHFSKNNRSRKVRNGVCTKGNDAIFLISQSGPKQPNMYDFANAFKTLGCKDALYLDGTISKLELGWFDQASDYFSTTIRRKRFGAFFIFR